jgi:hypothetical protein
VRSQDVEQGFSQPVRGRAHRKPLDRAQPSAAMDSAYHPHRFDNIRCLLACKKRDL